MLFVLFTLLTPAFAQENRNLYQDNPALTEGMLEDFRELYVDAETFASQVTPKEAADGTGKLVVYNRTSSPMELEINGERVGLMHPATPVILHGMPSGSYEVSLTSLSNFKSIKRVSTVPEDAPITEMSAPKMQSFERPGTFVSPPVRPWHAWCFTAKDAEEQSCVEECPEEQACTEIRVSECGEPCAAMVQARADSE
ncbi:MAG: hypothetical protein ACI9VR_001457 [Cognaticolwellia sp.]